MDKYMAGPWNVHTTQSSANVETLTGASHYETPYFAVVAADGSVVCDNADYYPQAVDPCNIPLIALSPELLESLEIMTALCTLKYGNLDAGVYAEIEKANALIAKAKGQ